MKIKKWFNRNFRTWERFSDELQKRIDEVIFRAKHACQRTFPDKYLETPFEDLIEWIITPHIKKEYEHYNYVNPEMDRGAERAVQKIMELREKFEQETTTKKE